jgi:hypothetical protein
MHRQVRTHPSLKVVFWAVLILVTSLACVISGGPGSSGIPTATLIPRIATDALPESPTQAGTTPVATGRPQPGSTAIPSPTKKASGIEMVALRQGLASLDTYVLTSRVLNTGPTSNDRSDLKVIYKGNNPKKSSHIHQESLDSTAEDPSTEVDISDTYQVSTRSCSISDGSSSGQLREVLPIQLDMNDTFATLIDANLMVDNPVFVAEETINGIPANHYRFVISRLGKDSGGVVSRNQGDLWVAKDGKYLVKYAAVLEISTNTTDKSLAQVMHSELTMELSAVNQPLEITIPANCVKK